MDPVRLRPGDRQDSSAIPSDRPDHRSISETDPWQQLQQRPVRIRSSIEAGFERPVISLRHAVSNTLFRRTHWALKWLVGRLPRGTTMRLGSVLRREIVVDFLSLIRPPPSKSPAKARTRGSNWEACQFSWDKTGKSTAQTTNSFYGTFPQEDHSISHRRKRQLDIFMVVPDSRSWQVGLNWEKVNGRIASSTLYGAFSPKWAGRVCLLVEDADRGRPGTGSNCRP